MGVLAQSAGAELAAAWAGDEADTEAVMGLIVAAKAAGAAIIGIFHARAVRARVANRIFEITPIPDAA